MILFKKATDLDRWLRQQRSIGKSVGFVPTLGALHEGHISLIDISKAATGVTVCSIFVNPTQFNDPKDFQKYPITIEKDILLLETAGTDALFLPDVAELYPGGTKELEKYELGYLETILEGKYRPGHFQGVCQVMFRLLDKVRPDHLFMGQKDYQQCMVVRRLIDLMGWTRAMVFHACPIVREADGLAMSSRNLRLSEEDRKKALSIYQALSGMKEGWMSGTADSKTLTDRARQFLTEQGFRVDYVEIADAATLNPLQKDNQPSNAVALVAAFMGEVRLIDNMLFG